jgi:uncharacterized protein YjaZ
LDSIDNMGKRFSDMKIELGNCRFMIIYEDVLNVAVPLVKQSLLAPLRFLQSKNDILIIISATDDVFVKDKMEGVSGYTPNGYTILININPDSQSWRDFIGNTVAHEFNHVIRFQKRGDKDGGTILAGLAFEGVAQCFAEDITGIIRPWSKALTEEDAKRIWENVKVNLDVRSKDLYNRIFIKKDDEEFPLWSGYTLSYLIVRKKVNGNGRNIDWEHLTGEDSKSLIENGPY